MNIIISSLNVDGIKILGEDTDIDLIKVYISKNLNITPKTFSFSIEEKTSVEELTFAATYIANLIAIKDFDKKEYNCYQLVTTNAIPLKNYKIVFNFEEEGESKSFAYLNTTIAVQNGLEDQHKIIDISDKRVIANITDTVVVAGDRNSQQLRFRISKCYDGISFIDESKQIFADFIPLDKSLLQIDESTKLAFLSDEITEIEVDPENNDYVILKWNLSPAVTSANGTVEFGISILNKDNKDYCWQTVPSKFTVVKYLGARPDYPVVSPDLPSAYTQLREDVDAIEALLGGQTTEDPSDDTEVLIGGGDASSYIE